MLGPNQQKWVDALRSGEYKQTKGTLRREYCEGKVGYCCLGVAAALFEGGPIRGGTLFSCPITYNALKMKSADGLIGYYGFATSLANLNDNNNFTFSEIADIIEQKAEQLFEEAA